MKNVLPHLEKKIVQRAHDGDRCTEIKIFVINLDKDKDRLLFMDIQLSAMNLSYTRIAGTIPNENDKINSYDQEFVLKHFKKNFRDGELGCGLSHYGIYKKIVEENIQKSIIFEDDVSIDQGGFLKTCEMLNESNGWEYASINYDTFNKNFRDKYLWNINISFFEKILKGFLIFTYRPIEIFQQLYGILFGPTLFSVIRPLHLSGCYCITLEGAKKILSTHGEKIRYLADYVQNEARKQKKLKLYFIAPQITKQANDIFASNTR